ncbi:heparinase II/III family protein [Novosphingobium endophyticum]|uniref:Heparinase II/III family protein n=1 Tax=Novosphingobium endophyticum TaxID=1955250 RepID=A0A916X3H9_9SPHN|nr:heparinase II/III family protein [Novosphingobium endophyticum]
MQRFWETVRHLKAEQILYRAWFRLYHPAPDVRAAPHIRNLAASWVKPARRTASLIGPTSFLFLNSARDLADIGWDGEELPKLWRYNQHYFDDLNAIGADARRVWHCALIERWIAENPPASGTGWEPYPTSLRIVNWVKWALAGNETPVMFRQSLAIQARWLSRRLERHLLGNHLFANAKALIFAGTLLGGDEGDAWHSTGTRILRRELPRQILSDGGHFELSPMYHALALEDVLDLINILRIGNRSHALLKACEERVTLMQAWLSTMSHPDGEISFFNDAAIGVAPASNELSDYAERLGFTTATATDPTVWLECSGYARVAVGDAVLLADLAQVGPSYLPGHAHADTLSFEFSLGLERVLVNGGTSLYGLGDERLRQRGTAAHNCVAVEGCNSSDVWSGFRVGQRARPLSPQVLTRGEGVILRAGHDGYRSLPGSPEHWRLWSFDGRSLIIEDTVTNPSLYAEAYFHLHPDVTVETTGKGYGMLILASGRQLTWRTSNEDCRLETGSWHPEFGVTRTARSIILPLREGRSAFEIHLDYDCSPST